jgi:hypothetical protein
MVITRTVVKAVATVYTTAQLEELRGLAAAALVADLPRVELTGTQFESGGSQGIFVQGHPAQVIELCQAAIDYQAMDGKQNTSIRHADFSRRQVGW